MKNKTLRIVVTIVAVACKLYWLDHCRGEFDISNAQRQTFLTKMQTLDNVGSLQANYLKSNELWNEAIRNKYITDENRYLWLLAAYKQMVYIHRVAPGYRKVQSTIATMEQALSNGYKIKR